MSTSDKPLTDEQEAHEIAGAHCDPDEEDAQNRWAEALAIAEAGIARGRELQRAEDQVSMDIVAGHITRDLRATLAARDAELAQLKALLGEVAAAYLNYRVRGETENLEALVDAAAKAAGGGG